MSFLTYSFFPPTPALSTISRPLSSSMCSITPETANVGSSYNRMRGLGIGCWFSDHSNCSHWSLTLTFTLTSENLSLYTTLLCLLVLIQPCSSRCWPMTSTTVVQGVDNHSWGLYCCRCYYIRVCWGRSCRIFHFSLAMQLKPLSHSIAIPRRWHGDLKFLRAPWDRTKILKNIANNFTFSITWRCHGAPTATVAFPRSASGVPPCSHGVLTGDWLRNHGALMACSWRAKSCHCASTSCTQRARRAQCVSTASSRSVYEHMRKQVLQANCRNRHAYKRELSDVIYCLIFVDVDIGNICVLFIYLFYLIISMLEKIDILQQWCWLSQK